jgi:methyl-accepting chemotaxis protein
MAKKSKLRVMLTVKLLVMFMIVVIISSLLIGIISYRNASKGLVQGVYTRIDAVSTDVVNKVVEINKRHFQTLHALAELTVIKDENASLAEKQEQLTHIASSIAANCENVAYYDANGDAIVADGRIMNFKTRAYFTEAFAGKDYASDEMAEGNKHITKEIARLQQSTDSMKGSIEEMQIGIERMNATAAALSVISGTVGENIRQIGSEIDLFKV